MRDARRFGRLRNGPGFGDDHRGRPWPRRGSCCVGGRRRGEPNETEAGMIGLSAHGIARRLSGRAL